MFRSLLPLPLLVWACVAAPSSCPKETLSAAAERAIRIQSRLAQISQADFDATIPPPAREQLSEFKSALSCVADKALADTARSVDAADIQRRLAQLLHANQPEASTAAVYGSAIGVHVRRSPGRNAMLEVEFSFGIPCSRDHMLLLYAADNSGWKEILRWQSPPSEEISGAFGDFFLTAVLEGPRVVVAHGTPWCTSRVSDFDIDILEPGRDSTAPRVLWRAERGYSRGNEVRLKSSNDTFELRLNRSTFDIDVAYERQVVFRYRLGPDGRVQRLNPIAMNARGFVEEWLTSPWEEASSFLASEDSAALKAVHNAFNAPMKSEDTLVANTYGPVRACTTAGTYQVQIDATRETTRNGKDESQPLPSQYFHVRETGNGYVMASVSTTPDRTCKGRDLMPPRGN